MKDERPILEIITERIFSRLLELPDDRRQEALKILRDTCLPVTHEWHAYAVKRLAELLGPIN